MADSADFCDVIGHEAVLDRFRLTLARDRLAGAYLFVGPAGVGKRRVASLIAASLLCEASEPAALAPCGVCETCRLLAAGNHPDLLVVERPANRSTIPIELLIGGGDDRHRRGLCHDLTLRPMLATRRVAILDDADSLGVEGANCLLKTLEEPPPRSTLFLIGTSLGKQLPTIRSRTQVIRFAPLSEPDVARVLSYGAMGIDAADAERIASQSGGSVAAALAASDDSLSAATDGVVACLSASPVDPSRLARLVEDETKQAGSEPRERRQRLAALLHAAETHYRDRLRNSAESSAPSDALEATADALDACLEAGEALGRNANQSALIQHLAGRLARIG